MDTEYLPVGTAEEKIDKNDPGFGDLVQTNTGYRLIVTRERTKGKTIPTGIADAGDYDTLFTGTDIWSVESIDISAGGTLSSAKVATLERDRFVHDTSSSRYGPTLVHATVGGNVFVLSNREGRSAEVVHLTDGVVVSRQGLRGINDVYDYDGDSNLFQNAA